MGMTVRKIRGGAGKRRAATQKKHKRRATIRKNRPGTQSKRVKRRASVQRQTAGKSGEEAAAKTFRRLQRQNGCGVMLVVAERAGEKWDQCTHVHEVRMSASRSKGRGAAGGLARVLPRTSQTLAAFGHVQRAKVMSKLLEGPATYRALQRLTKLKAGPLYYHINELRLAGLILPKQRDLYELTRGGRNLILVAVALGPLIRDGRRRPQDRSG